MPRFIPGRDLYLYLGGQTVASLERTKAFSQNSFRKECVFAYLLVKASLWYEGLFG
jgi:hypothetical protein